jgi:hypothetical protein
METVSSVGECLNAVRTIRRRWLIPEHKEMWFRAEDVRHHATKLRPKLYRPREGQALKPISELLRMDNQFYEEFARCGPQLCNLHPDDDWDFEWYFLMQHHGVPTRLLDWTDGALIALHFAVRQFAEHAQPLIHVLDPYWLVDLLEAARERADNKAGWAEYCRRHPTEDIDDWGSIYLPRDEDELKELPMPRVPILWDPPHVSGRVAAQRSRFMIFGADPEFLADLAKQNAARIEGIAVDPKAITTIQNELRDGGLTESVIFPDLDGLGRELYQSWQNRSHGEASLRISAKAAKK